jgi:hypothetical protein
MQPHLHIACCLQLRANSSSNAAMERNCNEKMQLEMTTINCMRNCIRNVVRALLRGDREESSAMMPRDVRPPDVTVSDVALLPSGTQSFPDQAIAVLHAERVLEQAAHLLPVRGGRARGQW